MLKKHNWQLPCTVAELLGRVSSTTVTVVCPAYPMFALHFDNAPPPTSVSVAGELQRLSARLLACLACCH